MKNLQSKIPLVLSILFILLNGCSKEEKLQERIKGTWITTSVKIDGVEEQNVWDPVEGLPRPVCGFNCFDEYKLVRETWSINENGNILVIVDKMGHYIDIPASENKCSCVYKPEFLYDTDYSWTWELSSDGKTFTIMAYGRRFPYDVQELTKTRLRLSQTVTRGFQEFTFEKH